MPACSRHEARLDQGAQHRPGSVLREPRRATSASRLSWQTSSAANMTASSRAAGRGSGACGMGAVIGLDGGEDGVSAAAAHGHGSGVPWLRQGRAGQTRARASPRQEIGSCETGLSWGMLLIVKISRFPGLGRMFMAHPHRRALACSGVWVRRLLQAARRNRHRVNL